jgi:hypothetical protein
MIAGTLGSNFAHIVQQGGSGQVGVPLAGAVYGREHVQAMTLGIDRHFAKQAACRNGQQGHRPLDFFGGHLGVQPTPELA